MSYNTRKYDILDLIEVIKNPMTSSGEKREAKESLKKITSESSLIRSMRQRLLAETRAGHSENVRDIREYVFGKMRYQ